MTKDPMQDVYRAAQADVTANTIRQLRELSEKQLMEVLRRGMKDVLDDYNNQTTDPSRRVKMVIVRDNSYGIGFAVYFEDEQPSVGYEKAKHKDKYSSAPFLPPLLDLRVNQDKEKLSILNLSYDKKKSGPISWVPLATVLHGSAPILSDQDHETIFSAIECALMATNCSDRLAHQQALARIRQHEQKQSR